MAFLLIWLFNFGHLMPGQRYLVRPLSRWMVMYFLALKRVSFLRWTPRRGLSYGSSMLGLISEVLPL